MAKDDVRLIMYKILKYLYECMKNDKETRLEDFSWESKLFVIPQNYWCEVIAMLVEKHLIKGFDVVKTKDQPLIQTNPPFKITYDGVEFLEENRGMQKAKDACLESYKVILSSLLGIIIRS